MKAEHRDYIDRAALHGCLPSVLAHELLAHDLVNAALFELKNIHAPYPKLNEGQQQEVIERITEKVEDAVRTAIGIISSRNVTTIEMTMKEVKFNSKQLTLTSIVDAKNPERHQLIDSAGHLCLLVMAPHDYDDGLDFIQPDRDQREMPLHVSDLTGSLFEQPAQLGTKEELAAHIAAGNPVAEIDSGEDLSAYDDTLVEGQDPLYSEAVLFVTESRRPSISAIQRKLKIGYNRSARILEAMELAGLVTAPNTNGMREVLIQQPPARDDSTLVSKEFGDYSYDEAAQVIVLKAQDKGFKAHWVQSRLAVSSDQVTTLLLRLLDNGVIEVETEGESALEHSYKVIATLDQVV